MRAKFITVILMVIMTMLMMTACGSSGAVEAPAEGNDQQVEESAAVSDPSDIGAEKAKQIVLAKVPGAVEASIYEFERDYEDGRLEYEGSLYHDGYEYEFEVDGVTGSILQWEIDD